MKNEFNIVFSPNNRLQYGGRKRFLISFNRLAFYVGSSNANTAVSRALNSKTDKTIVRLRKHGKLEFYIK